MEYELHTALGTVLKITRHNLYDQLKNYKTKNQRKKSYESKAIKHIDSLRNILDEIVFKEYPGMKSDEKMRIYYG